MIFGHAGGMWCAGPELLCTLRSCPDLDNAVIEDSYGTPIKIDVQEMIFLAEQRWQEQMNAWLVEYEELRTKR